MDATKQRKERSTKRICRVVVPAVVAVTQSTMASGGHFSVDPILAFWSAGNHSAGPGIAAIALPIARTNGAVSLSVGWAVKT